MYHGLKYASDGLCVEVPGQKVFPANARLRVYPVVEKYTWLWVWMGEPEKADQALIPDALGIDHPDWSLKPGHLDYQANQMLICDNLLDFTHLAYVHPASFGVSEAWALASFKVSRGERSVHVERWVVDQPPPSQQQELGQIDYFNTYDFILPGILLMYEYIFPAGTAQRFEDTTPSVHSPGLLSASFTLQAVTPMTKNTTRYFFAWGPRKIEDVDGLGDAFADVAVMAFGEDKEMIEAQQKIVDASPDRRMMVIGADKALIYYRQLLAKMLSAESTPEISVPASSEIAIAQQPT